MGERRERPSREELEALVLTADSVKEVALALDTNAETVRRWIRHYGLPQPIDIRRSQREDALAAGEVSIQRKCRRHGQTSFALVGSERRPRCKRCRAEAVARRRRRVKETLAAEAGGKRVLCGYDRSLSALQFHHRDRKTKSFGIAERGLTRSIMEVREEAKKCALLCSNCHAEVEAGETDLPLES